MSVPDKSIPLETAVISGIVSRALTRFRRLSGLNAVVSLESPARGPLLPTVHPRCARAIRTARTKPPCDVEWRKHVQHAHTKQRCRQHVCPLGLRCASVPVMLGGQVVGLAKCVAGREITRAAFASNIEILQVLMTGSSQEIELFTLRKHIDSLQRSLDLKVRAGDLERSVRSHGRRSPLIAGVVEYLHAHYRDPEIDLAQVARAARRSEKYVAHEFVVRVGMRMRAYINNLRLHHACELLLESRRPVEEIARECGFVQVARFREVFRRSMGVTPTQYRRIFSGALATSRVH